MKKAITFILMICFMITSVSAFALTGEEIFEEYTNYDAQVKMSLRLEEFPEQLLDSLNNDFVDVKVLLDGLMSTGYQADVKVNSSDDFKKMTMYMNTDFSVPLNFNERLKVGVDASADMWIDMDLRDVSDLKYKIVYLTPVNKKYMYIDNVFEFPKSDEQMYEEMKKVFDFASDKDFRDKAKSIVKKNSKITVSGNRISVITDASGIKNLIADFMDLLMEKEILKGVDTVSLAGIKAMILAFPLDKETMINAEYTYKNGELSLSKSTIDVCFDVNEVTAYTNKLSGMEETEKIDGESRVKFGYDIECVYNSVNKPVEITVPELTLQNSIDITKMMNQGYTDEYVPEEFNHSRSYTVSFYADNTEDIKNLKIPAEYVFDGLEMYRYSYELEKADSLNIKKGWWKDDITIKENSAQVILGEKTIELSEPFTTFEEGFTIAQIEEIFNLRYDGVRSYNYEYGEFDIVFDNPDYVPPVYETEEHRNTIDSWRYVYVDSQGNTGYNKEKIILDFKDVIKGFAVEENAVVNANGNINFNFYNRYITFTPGSNVIIVNGKEIPINIPVAEVDGRYLVSCDFVEKAFNCSLRRIVFNTVEEGEVSILCFANNSYVYFDW